MVYCRRPSKYCVGCRKRRIKCDLRVPACTQCTREGMKCTGYRDQLSLLFRDENAKTKHRSVMAKDRSRDAERRRIQLLDASADTGLHTVSTSSIDDCGLMFFLDRFSTVPKWMVGCGQSHISAAKIHPFIKSIISKEQTRDALVSVGLAALSNITSNKTYHVAAVQRYVTGIKYVQQALAKPTNENLEDAIKLTVILILYEFVTRSPDSDSFRSWNVHADGALAIVRRMHNGRVPAKPQNMADLQTYFFFIMKYFGSGGDIPREILHWSFPVYSSLTLSITSNLISILIRLVRLSVTLRDPSCSVNAKDVVEAALGINRDLDSWEAGLVDDDWSFVTKSFDQPLGLYEGKYHVYNNVWASRVLNHYRYARILVNEVLYTYTLELETPANSHFLQRQQHSALTTISRVATEICISVPSHCTLFGHSFGSLSTEQPDAPPLNGVFVLIFSLIIAGSAIGVSYELHEWVLKILQTIDSSMGIRHAAELIPLMQRMRSSKRAEFWSGAQIWSIA